MRQRLIITASSSLTLSVIDGEVLQLIEDLVGSLGGGLPTDRPLAQPLHGLHGRRHVADPEHVIELSLRLR